MTPAQRRLARLALGLPSADQVYRAAVAWCGEKERETFPEDIEYFRHNWHAFPGLRTFVDREITRAGAEAALDPGESLSAEDFPADLERVR